MTGADLRLYVNIDHVATLREARKTDEPDPVEAARYCEDAGADGITVHLREDRRHIQDRDVEQLRRNVRTVLNLELATSEDVVAFACRIHPYQATVVPERREEVTTEGGLDLQRSRERLRETIDRLRQIGARVSLFIDRETGVSLDAGKCPRRRLSLQAVVPARQNCACHGANGPGGCHTNEIPAGAIDGFRRDFPQFPVLHDQPARNYICATPESLTEGSCGICRKEAIP